MTNTFFPEIHGKFGFGCMRLPMQGGEVDLPQFCDMVDAFLASGLNYFDTAHGYLGGKSETALRRPDLALSERQIHSDQQALHAFLHKGGPDPSAVRGTAQGLRRGVFRLLSDARPGRRGL